MKIQMNSKTKSIQFVKKTRVLNFDIFLLEQILKSRNSVMKWNLISMLIHSVVYFDRFVQVLKFNLEVFIVVE